MFPIFWALVQIQYGSVKFHSREPQMIRSCLPSNTTFIEDPLLKSLHPPPRRFVWVLIGHPCWIRWYLTWLDPCPNQRLVMGVPQELVGLYRKPHLEMDNLGVPPPYGNLKKKPNSSIMSASTADSVSHSASDESRKTFSKNVFRTPLVSFSQGCSWVPGLVNQHNYRKWIMYSWFTHQKLWFSIVTLVYQRVPRTGVLWGWALL